MRLNAIVSAFNNVSLGDVVVVVEQIRNNYSVVVLLQAVNDVVVSELVGLAASNDGSRRNRGNLAYGRLNYNCGVELASVSSVREGYNRTGVLVSGLEIRSGHLTLVSAVLINGNLVAVQRVLGAVDLDLSAIGTNVSSVSGYNRVIQGVNAQNLVVLAGHNLNALIHHVGQILREVKGLRTSRSRQAVVVDLLDSVNDHMILGSAPLAGSSQGSFVGGQIEVLLANGLTVATAVGVPVKAVCIGGPYNTVCIQGVVDDLCSVLTRQSGVQVCINIVQQLVLGSQTDGLLIPACAGQTALSRLVTHGYEQHLGSLNTSYGCVRNELGSGLTSDDVVSLAVLDVASSPVRADISERSGSRLVGICIGAARTSNIDHFCHLSAGNGTVWLERAVLKTVDYAEGSKSVHSFGSLNVSRIRERCTSKHGECASKRQYQCKNLFEIRAGVAITRKTRVKFQKIHPICNISKKRFLQVGYILWIQPVRQSQSQTSTYII